MKKLCIPLIGILLLMPIPTVAITNYYVATNGPGGAFTNWATAASNIQDAIDRTIAGDVVWVSNGIYNTGGGYTNYPSGDPTTNRVAITKAITMRSWSNNPTNTIIMGAWDPVTTNGPACVRCVYMINNASLIGFMLTNGAVQGGGYGGGLYCAGSGDIISNCVITCNSAGATGRGGGVNQGSLYNCTVTGNSANMGGGGYACIMFDCMLVGNFGIGGSGYGGGAYSVTLSNCAVAGNSAKSGGGGYSCTMYNCTVSGNSANVGGAGSGAGAYSCTMYNCEVASNSAGGYFGGGGYACTMYNCTVVHNSGSSGGGGGVRGGSCLNCIVYYNTGGNWYDTGSSFTNSCTYPTQTIWQVADRNITNDPSFMNTNAGNYRLSQGSPCINAGNNQYAPATPDLDGHSRIDRYSGIVDMGCYEYLPSGMMIKVP